MAKNRIKLDGWYSDATLGGSFKVFRGYADLKTLARISVPFYYGQNENAGYQREIIESHAREINTFFEEQSYRFIPEIILGVRLDSTKEIVSLTAGFTEEERATLLNPEENTSEVQDISQASKPIAKLGKKASLTIDLDELDNDKETIRRVDGNHRLFFAEDLKVDPNSPSKYVVPYCMILLGPLSHRYDDFAEAMIFYNINQKGIPITSEHGFNVLLTAGMEEARLFSEDPILFGAQYLKQELQICSPELKGIFGELPLTNLHAIVKILKEDGLFEFKDKDTVKSSLKDLITKINQFYCWALTENLRIAQSFKIVPAISLILLDADKRATLPYWLKSYDRWIVSNHLLEDFESVKPAEIWSIFRKWKDNQPKVLFVACSFRKAEELEAVKKMIKEAIDKVTEKHPDIRVEAIRIDESKGESFKVPPKIFKDIDTADLLIADLTDERPNVYCEVGYAKAKGIPFILTFRPKNAEEGKLKNKVHTDLQPYKYVQYFDASTLRDELIKELEGFYGVSGT